MLFEAEPEHVEALDSRSLVQLMKRLMLAECRLSDIPLRAAAAPLQITVADGGEDGRVEWTGGRLSTDYFPARFTLFQSKAQNLNTSGIKAETWRKTKVKPPALSDALLEVLARGGAYVVFCGRAFANKKRDSLVKAIANGIKEGGGDPSKALALEVYDANLIADWVNTHPPVALWLASLRLGRPVQGFQSHESWGRSPEIANVPWKASGAARFIPMDGAVPATVRTEPPGTSWTYDQAVGAIQAFLSNAGAIVRVTGPSGFGKTRFVYELLGRPGTVADQIDTASVIFADGTISGVDAVKLAMEMADTGFAAILVIDECSDELHNKLAQMVQRAGSRLRLITIDIETRIVRATGTLSLRLERAADDHIKEIAKGVASSIGDAESRFIADLAEGFPRIAVLAAQHNADSRHTLESVEQILERVIWGFRPKLSEAEKALEIASLFEWIKIQDDVDNQAACIATQLANMNSSAFVEHLLSFESRGIISRRGDFVQVGPVPLAARLGLKRLSVVTVDQLIQFFREAPEALKASLLKRMRWLDSSPVAARFVQHLLQPTVLGNFMVLNTEFGSKCLDRLVQVNPDTVAAAIERVFGALTIDELKAARDGRRYLVWTLEKLVFRKETFNRAATLLRKLAVAENEEGIGNNATGQFKRLYQLQLSGTEAEPAARLLVVDDGLKSNNQREREVCLEALETMLDTGPFSRSSGAEHIGSAGRLEDWRPKTYGEIWDFYRAAVTRLATIATSNDPLAQQARAALGQHIRGLLNSMPLEDVKTIISGIIAHTGFWPEAICGISEWLYYDRKEAPADIALKIRSYFEELVPLDPLDAVALYTGGWKSDLHDPDTVYDDAPEAKHDFEYSARKAAAVAEDIANDAELLEKAVNRFACCDAKSIFAFARQLAISAPDPETLFSHALQVVDATEREPNRGFFSGLIAGAHHRDQDLARSLVRGALKSPKLRTQAITLIGSGQLQSEDIELVVVLLRNRDVEPWQCASLSYGRGLDHLPALDFMPLLEELEEHGADGLWTILEIAAIYLHGGKQPDKMLIKLLKRVLINTLLLTKVRSNMDGYHLEKMIGLLSALGEIKVTYARQLAKQLMSICERKKDRAFYELDDPVRKCLDRLMRLHPDEVWTIVSMKAVDRSWYIRSNAKHLLGARYGNEYLGRRSAFFVPIDLILKWVRNDPGGRAALAVDWLSIAFKGEDGSLKWAPEIEAFVTEFGDIPNVLDSLSDRLYPTSWSGSLATHLEPLIPLLESWRTHSSSAVRAWVGNEIDSLRAKIRTEIKRSEEDEVRYT